MDMATINEFIPIKFLIVLGKLHRSVFGNVERHIKTLGLSTPEFLALYAIAANGPLTIQDIGSRIDSTSANMTYTIDKLEKRKLIKRKRCDQDRRKIYIDFTDQGDEMWQVTMKDHMAYLAQVFEVVDESTLITMIDLMKTMGKKLDEIES